MRWRLALAVAAVAALGACGRQGDVTIVWRGETPKNSRVADNRVIELRCPLCGRQLAGEEKRCPDQKKCGAAMRWKDDYRCGYCDGTGECPTCRLMNQKDGKCYNCLGHGYLTMQGKTPGCPNCGKDGQKGDGKCIACRGKQRCDFCEGNGKVALTTLKGKIKAPETEN